MASTWDLHKKIFILELQDLERGNYSRMGSSFLIGYKQKLAKILKKHWAMTDKSKMPGY